MRADQLAAARAAQKRLADIGLRHQPDHRPRAVIERDQRAPERHAGDEAARAVDRIDHPGQVAGAVMIAMFLAQHAVIGIAFADQLPDRGFGVAVGCRDRIEGVVPALVVDAEARAEMRQRHGGGRRAQFEGEMRQFADFLWGEHWSARRFLEWNVVVQHLIQKKPPAPGGRVEKFERERRIFRGGGWASTATPPRNLSRWRDPNFDPPPRGGWI